jgi:hypothetical protein
MRDLLFHPMSRVPGGRGQMLRVLSGTRRGWLGAFALPEGFLDALTAMQRREDRSANDRLEATR